MSDKEIVAFLLYVNPVEDVLPLGNEVGDVVQDIDQHHEVHLVALVGESGQCRDLGPCIEVVHAKHMHFDGVSGRLPENVGEPIVDVGDAEETRGRFEAN